MSPGGSAMLLIIAEADFIVSLYRAQRVARGP